MRSHLLEAYLDRLSDHYSYYTRGALLDRLQQPSVTIPLLLLLLTIFYQSLHSSPLSRPRHLGELLWGFIISATPADILYALEGWLHPPVFPTSQSVLSTRSRSYAAKSELLRRILGMDGPVSIITSVADAGRRSFSGLSSRALIKHNTDQPPGLVNYDNSCFQNSILQGLSSLESFHLYLARSLEQDKSEGVEELGSASSLRDLLSKLTDNSYNGKTLWTPKKLKSLDTWQQQDAQEYFSKILDEVEKEITKASKSNRQSAGFEVAGVRDDTEDSQHSDDSGYQSLPALSKAGLDSRLLRNPLEGLVAQRVACIQCGHSDGLSMIPFNCLTLSLGIEQTEHDLYERLDAYTDLETIEGVECARCTLLKLQRLLKIIISRNQEGNAAEAELREPVSRLEAVGLALDEDDFQETTLRDRCKVSARVSSTKTKQVVIARPPQSLAIHMNRSVFDENTGHMLKNPAAVRFPKTLNLGPWCLGSAGGPINPANDNTSDLEDEEEWVIDPRSSMVSGALKPSRISGPVYKLRSVITHQGRHENGHYVCYRMHPRPPPKSSDTSTDNSIEGHDESILVDETSDESADTDTEARWWRLSDESVSEVPEEAVLAQGGVFMLFYDCVDPKSVLVSTIRHGVQPGGDSITHSGGHDVNVAAEVGDVHGILRGFPPESDGEPPRLIQKTPSVGSVTSQMNDDSFKSSPSDTWPPGEGFVKSILIPSLKPGERVDPTIPLRRPNR